MCSYVNALKLAHFSYLKRKRGKPVKRRNRPNRTLPRCTEEMRSSPTALLLDKTKTHTEEMKTVHREQKKYASSSRYKHRHTHTRHCTFGDCNSGPTATEGTPAKTTLTYTCTQCPLPANDKEDRRKKYNGYESCCSKALGARNQMSDYTAVHSRRSVNEAVLLDALQNATRVTCHSPEELLY